NPISPEADFRPRQPRDREKDAYPESPGSTVSASGTDDLLLFRDIVEALALAYARDTGPCEDAGQLGEGLKALPFFEGMLPLAPRGVGLFRPDGRRSSATGEHVVHLRPRYAGGRVQPEAVLEVWFRKPPEGDSNIWAPSGAPLEV